MKFLCASILYTPYTYGGAERTLQTIAEGLVAKGHEVTVFTTGPDAGIEEEQLNGVNIIRTGMKNVYWHAVRNKPSKWKRGLWHLLDIYNPFMKKVAAGVLAKVQPDVVSLHCITGFSASIIDAVYEANIPMMQVLHDQYLICPRCTMFNDHKICQKQCLLCKSMRLFHPSISNKITAAVGVSQFILDHHLKFGYFQKTPIKTVIHNARNDQESLAVPRKPVEDSIRFGFIGSLMKNKGIELLLNSFKEIANEKWELHIAGNGPAQYEKFLKNTYESAKIHFLGVQNPKKFYPNIDVLVVPSVAYDTFPGVVFEGFSYGIPVIGSRLGGITEQIKENINGLIFDPTNPKELQSTMTKMAEDTDFRISASNEARKSAPYYLDMERFINSYESLGIKLIHLKV